MSLGSNVASNFLRNGFDRIFNQDNVLLIAASGNGRNSAYHYPASYSSVISVGSITSSKRRSSFSQFNDQVELVGPGSNIRSTVPGGRYANWDGTCMATPHVSGVAALVWSHFPAYTAREVRTALAASAEDLGPRGRDDEYGHGLVRADLAYNFLDPRVTALHETHDNFEFLLAPNLDLYAIKKSATGSGKTEVHVLSKASRYTRFNLHQATGLHETHDNFEFALAPNLDLYAIKKSLTGSGKTEVHVLSKASNYNRFSLHQATGLHETHDNFEFALAPNLDLYAIKKSATGSGKTEVHVLSKASSYTRFNLHQATGLHETNNNWEFALAPNLDVIGVAKRGTGSGKTEAHVLPRATNYN